MNLLTDGIKSKAVMLTQGTKKLSIDNHTQVYPVYKIRLDQLYFNDQNDRIATWISQYKTEHADIALESLGHPEYNDIIQGFIVESNPDAIKKTQKRANALKNITIPTYSALVYKISNELEEKEREEFTRLKVIKRMKQK